MSNHGEQRQVKQVSPRTTETSRSSLLLPGAQVPTVIHGGAGGADKLDVIMAIVTLPVTAAALRRLPHAARWAELNERSAARTGTVRSIPLPTPAHTQAILGYLKSDASAFERLTLAGRMVKEAAARNPQSVGLAAAGTGTLAGAHMEALLAATLAHSSALPTLKAPVREERAIRRIVLLGEHKIDEPLATASARGTNLVRWLTALPPNILDAQGYRQAITRLARTNGLTMEWLDERALRRAGAGAFLAVAQGNGSPGRASRT